MSADFIPLSSTVRGEPPSLLAVLPNGEAVRASLVRSVSIREQPGLIGQEDSEFSVVVELDDGIRCIVAANLSAADATDLARRTGRIVNDALRTP